MKHRYWLLPVALMALGVGGARAQIPVIDGASLGQQVQQVLSWGMQLKAMADQYQQQVKQFQAMTGARGFGNLFNDPALQQYLTADQQALINQLRANGAGGLSAGAQAFRQQIGDTRGGGCSLYADTRMRANCYQNMMAPYQQVDAYQSALNVANQKPQQIQSLISAIQTTDDPKSIAELQARIAGEQAAMQNEMLRMQITVQLAEVQNRLVKEQAERDEATARASRTDAAYDAAISNLRKN